MSQRRFEYDPSVWEQGSALLGKIAAPLGTAAVLKSAIGGPQQAQQAQQALGGMPNYAAMPSMAQEQAALTGADTDVFDGDGVDPYMATAPVRPALNTLPEDDVAFTELRTGRRRRQRQGVLSGPWDSVSPMAMGY